MLSKNLSNFLRVYRKSIHFSPLYLESGKLPHKIRQANSPVTSILLYLAVWSLQDLRNDDCSLQILICHALLFLFSSPLLFSREDRDERASKVGP